jgi:hypothetical protein
MLLAHEMPSFGDVHNRYEIALPQPQVPLLREFLRYTCASFEQETLYFVVGQQAEYIPNPLGWPPPDVP